MALAYADRAPSLEDRITSVMGVVNAASAELVSLVGEALESGEWEQFEGSRSPEQWVTLMCGVSSARAAALVATARGMADLPACRSLFEAGALTEDQARAIASGTDAAHDREIADLAPLSTVSQLRRLVRSLPTPESEPDPAPDSDDAPSDPNADAPNRREVAFGYCDDGRWWCRAVLPAEEGAVVQAALERARDAEFRLRRPDAAHDESRPVAADVSWADGLTRLAEAALYGLDRSEGRPGDRFQVYLHVQADAPLSAYLHLGPSVSDSVRRYLTCDAPIRFVFEQDGRIVALSEKQDTVDTKTRKLVEHRDGGCRVPGCSQRRWLHVHHIIHREDHGPTVLENLCCLCPAHHRLHHAGPLHIAGDPTRPDGLIFTTPNGRRIGPAPPRPPGAPPRHAARRLGIPDGEYKRPLGERINWHWITWS